MAIIIRTEHPEHLLNLFQEHVISKNIVTWLVDTDGDFTIANERWTYKAWMHPVVHSNSNELIFGFVASRKHEITKGLYGIYHGRLSATLLSHYDDLITSIEIRSALDPTIDVF